MEIRAKKVALLLALPIALLVLISPFTPELVAFLKRTYAVPEAQPVIIELSRPAVEMDSKVLDNMIAQGMYVSNYDVEILAKFDNTAFAFGEPVRFTLSVKDKGILKLLKPYFYVFVVDPEGKVRAVFPPLSQASLSPMYKWPQWWTRDETHEIKDVMYVKTGDRDYLVPRPTLINGSGRYVYVANGYQWTEKPASVKMQFVPKETEGLKAGLWSVYTFVFDDSYVDRQGKKIESANAVGYAIHTFQVVGKSIESQEAPGLLPFFSKLIPALFGALGAFILLYRAIISKYATLNRLYEKMKEEKILLIGFILIILAFLSVLLLGLASLMRTPATT